MRHYKNFPVKEIRNFLSCWMWPTSIN